MKRNSMLALVDALNDRQRTTAAFSLLVDLIDHANRSDGPDLTDAGPGGASLLDLFAEKMRASDNELASLVREAAPELV